ncbi:MAG: hypothetical protein LBH43_04170 [Treponema sp.]|nr:hypothetical protein [Treponema sp.]
MKRISVILLAVFLFLGATSAFAFGGKEKSSKSKATGTVTPAAEQVQKGITALNAREFDNAAGNFDQAISLDKDNVTAYIGRVYASYVGGIIMDPEDEDDYLSLAVSLSNDFRKSFTDFAALITLTGEAKSILDTLEENLERAAAPTLSDHDLYMQMMQMEEK